MSFIETKERNLFIASYLNYNLESFIFKEKEFYFLIINNEIGQSLTSLVEISEVYITSDFLDFLDDLVKNKDYKSINFRLTPSLNIPNSDVIKELLLRNYNSYLSFTSLKLLTLSENAIFSGLRKSLRLSIKKEMKRVNVKFYDSTSNEDHLFSDWIILYSFAINRGNRKLSDEAIAIMDNTIKNNMGFVVLAYENGIPLGAVLFNYYKGFAYYSAAANSRSIEEQNDRYIAHFLIWQGIKKLKELGCHILEIGPLDFDSKPSASTDLKLLNITKFKLSFKGNIVPVFNFTKSLFSIQTNQSI